MLSGGPGSPPLPFLHSFFSSLNGINNASLSPSGAIFRARILG